MARRGLCKGMLAVALAFGVMAAGCDNGNSGGGGDVGGGGTGSGGWSAWRSVTLAGHTDGVQFSWWMVGPEPPQGSVVEVQVEGLTPTSFTLSASTRNAFALAPQAGATFRFRYRQNGGRGHSGTNPIHFLW